MHVLEDVPEHVGDAAPTWAEAEAVVASPTCTANAPLRVAVPLVYGLKKRKMVKCKNYVKHT